MPSTLATARPVVALPPIGRPPLLVAVQSAADVDGQLAQAVGRVRAERRDLLVAIIAPPHPLTIDAAIHQRHARQVSDHHDTLAAAVERQYADVPVRILRVRRPWSVSRDGGRRGLQRRLAALARRHGAELHPLAGPAPVDPRREEVVR